MAEDSLAVHAFEVVEALQTVFPHLHFQAYQPLAVQSPFGNLVYIFGFVTRETLLGGYAVPLDEEMGFAMHVVAMVQFFRKAEQAETPFFFPPDVQSLYEQHRDIATQWYRVA